MQGSRGAGAVRVGLVGERPDVARVVCVRPHPRGGRGVSRSGEIAHRPCAGLVSLRVLVGPGEGGRDFDVPARKAAAELAPATPAALVHPRLDISTHPVLALILQQDQARSVI